MATAAQQVTDVFNQATGFVANYAVQANTFLGNLNTIAQSMPSAPALSAPGAAPAGPGNLTIGTLAPTTIDAISQGSTPGAIALDAPSVDVPSDSIGDVPNITLGDAPTLSYGSMPSIPSVADIMIGDSPVLTSVAPPTLLSLSTPSFGGVNLHEDQLAVLTDLPVLELVSPTPYSYSPGPNAAEARLQSLKDLLAQRLQGGTGLNPIVEQAIWDRARDRETQIANANRLEVQRQSDALGFQLPAGVISAQMRQAEQEYYDKLSELSRDVGIKQAELEQENLKLSITQAMDLEKQVIDYSWKMEQMAFDAARILAENAIQIYNAEVEGYKAKLSSYNLFIEAYKALIQAELSKVEVYKAEIEAEKAKAETNNTLVQQYKAQIEAGMAQVEVYRVQVGAAQAKMQLEQAKIGVVGEQIRAYVAQINGETSKVEAYKARVQAEAAKTDVYRVKADVFKARASVQIEKAKAEIARYQAQYQAKASEWDGYKAYMAAQTARVGAQAAVSEANTHAYKAQADAQTAQYQAQVAKYGADIKLYEANISLNTQTARIAADWAHLTASLKADAAKTGAQVYAQLTASGMSMLHAQASIGANATNSVSYSYSNDTASTVSSKTEA